MSKILTVKNKLLTLSGEMYFIDGSEREIFTAKGEFSLLNPSWSLFQNEREIGQIRRKLWSWSTKFLISFQSDNFVLRRKSWSWKRKYFVLGGRLDGAIITGGFWDTSFEIAHGDRTLAIGNSQILSLRDTCQVTIYDTAVEQHLAAIIVAMRLDKQSESDSGVGGGGD